MKPTITAARAACEAIGARQVVVVAFDALGQYAVVSYGATREECRRVRVTCDAVAEALKAGELPAPEAD